jgi:hypothetical protein
MAVATSPIADYQTRLPRASQIKPGDFLDHVDANPNLRGGRGGKYRYDGVTVGSRVESVSWVIPSDVPGLSGEIGPGEFAPLGRIVGFKIKTRNGSFTLPGNLAELTSAVVRRAS